MDCYTLGEVARDNDFFFFFEYIYTGQNIQQ